MGLEDGESHVFEFNSSDKSTDPEDAVCVETINVPYLCHLTYLNKC